MPRKFSPGLCLRADGTADGAQVSTSQGITVPLGPKQERRENLFKLCMKHEA